jgi:hypothetical protein
MVKNCTQMDYSYISNIFFDNFHTSLTLRFIYCRYKSIISKQITPIEPLTFSWISWDIIRLLLLGTTHQYGQGLPFSGFSESYLYEFSDILWVGKSSSPKACIPTQTTHRRSANECTCLFCSSSKRKPRFYTCTCQGDNKNVGHGSRRDLKPGMTVLARTSSNLTDWSNPLTQCHSGSRQYTRYTSRQLGPLHYVLTTHKNVWNINIDQMKLFLLYL